MDKEFKQFGESARLYAKYSDVVEEMWVTFKADVSVFLDSLHDRLASGFNPGELKETSTGAYRSWYIEDQATNHLDYPAYIYVHAKDPAIVVPGVLTATIYYDGSEDYCRRQISAVQSLLSLPEYCKIEKSGRFFCVHISYGDGNAIEAAAAPLATLLTVLHETDLKLVADAKEARPAL